LGNLNEKKKGITVTIGNRKGGVSKTTTTIMLAYCLAKRGIRTLVCDFDPQGNATKNLFLTAAAHAGPDEKPLAIGKTLMAGVSEKSLKGLPLQIMPNLFLLPSFIDFESFPKYLYQEVPDDAIDFVMSTLLDDIKGDYDIVLIDTPPMSLEITNNAIVASDYVLIPMQTQERSLSGVESYLSRLQDLATEYQLPLLVMGILPVLLDKSKVDEYILQNAVEEFGEPNIFKTVIKKMERLKRFDITGITEKDMHDKNVVAKFDEVTDEFLVRLNILQDMKKKV